jgi:hypothetical protein
LQIGWSLTAVFSAATLDPLFSILHSPSSLLNPLSGLSPAILDPQSSIFKSSIVNSSIRVSILHPQSSILGLEFSPQLR